MLGNEQLSKPMGISPQLDPNEKHSAEIMSKLKSINTRKCLFACKGTNIWLAEMNYHEVPPWWEVHFRADTLTLQMRIE